MKNHRKILGLLLCGLLSACGDDAGETMSTSGSGGSGSAGASGGSGGSGGVGGSGGGSTTTTNECDVCPAGSHLTGDCECEATLGEWAVGPTLLNARDHHVTFIAEVAGGTFLYAAAGASALGGALTTVERAAVAADGSLGAFEMVEKLPKGLIGPGLAQVESSFVIAGGLTSSGGSTAESWVGAVKGDGHLAYQPGPALTDDRYHVSLVAAKGFVFALGGLKQTVVGGMATQSVSDLVERATFDGKTLSDFAAIGTLPTKLTHHTAFYHADALYVLGGGTGEVVGGTAPATTDILRATLSDTGELGPWLPAGKLPEARATASATIFLGQLYVFAGMESLVDGERDTVLRGSLTIDGTVGPLDEALALPTQRAHTHQTPLHAGFFYSAGGSINHKPQKDVFVGRLK